MQYIYNILYIYAFHILWASPKMFIKTGMPHLPTWSLRMWETGFLDANNCLACVIAALPWFLLKFTCCWFCSVFLQHITHIISPKVKSPWGIHLTTPSFCTTHQVHPAPWARTIPWMGLPFPNVGATHTAFPSHFPTCTTETVSPATVFEICFSRTRKAVRFCGVKQPSGFC